MKKIIGILLIAISAAAFGTLGIFGRYAEQDGADLFTVLFLRFGISALILTVVLILRGEHFPRGRLLAQLVGMGALGYVGQSFTYLTAINHASAGLVALLLYLYPLFVTILSVIFLGEQVTRLKIGALTIALLGAALTVDPQGGQLLGALLAVSAALIYSVYIIVGANVMKHVSAIQSSTVIFASAGGVYGILTLIKGAQFPQTSTGWYAIAGMILIATLVAVVTFLAGLEMVGAINAAMLSTLEPIVTVLLAAWLFSERLSIPALFGGSLILVSVVLVTRSELKASPPAATSEPPPTYIKHGNDYDLSL